MPTTTCRKCGTKLKARESATGGAVACPECEQPVAVPATTSSPEQAPRRPTARPRSQRATANLPDEEEDAPRPRARPSRAGTPTQKRSPNAATPALLIVAGVLLLGFLIAGGLVALVASRQRSDAVADSGPPIDANGAARMYEENEVAADRNWLGKRVRVTKRGVTVGRDGSGVAFVSSPLEYGGASTTRDGTGMAFYFDKADESGIAEIKPTWPPQAVTIEGVCRGKRGRFVVVENCKVIKVATGN